MLTSLLDPLVILHFQITPLYITRTWFTRRACTFSAMFFTITMSRPCVNLHASSKLYWMSPPFSSEAARLPSVPVTRDSLDDLRPHGPMCVRHAGSVSLRSTCRLRKLIVLSIKLGFRSSSLSVISFPVAIVKLQLALKTISRNRITWKQLQVDYTVSVLTI